MGLKQIKTLVWGESPSTKAERKLLRKIDFFILTYCCVSYFFNYLDRAALANAYVSGMKEDLGLAGTDYNVLVALFSVGYIVGQVPHGLIIQVVPPRIWFPLMTALWGVLTMCSAAAQNFGQLGAIRLLQGIAESSTYSGTQYIIGSWYKPQEIGKRIGVFDCSGLAGTMFAGIMMTAIYETLDGHSGLPGWRWVFIIDGIISFPIAIFGFFSFPDLPENTKAMYLSAEEKQLAVSRLPEKDPQGHKIGLALVKRVLTSLNFWIFVLFWMIGGLLESYATQSCMLLWMKATERFSVPQINDYPLVITAVAIIATFLTSVGIDATGKHAQFGFLACGIQIICSIILLCWKQVGDSAKFAAYYLAGTCYMIQPIVFTWANEVLARDGDDAARAVILYAMNGASSVLFTFWGIVLFPATDAGTGYFKGTISMVVVSVVLSLWIVLVWMQDRRMEKKYGLREVPVDSKTVEETAVTPKVDDGMNKDLTV